MTIANSTVHLNLIDRFFDCSSFYNHPFLAPAGFGETCKELVGKVDHVSRYFISLISCGSLSLISQKTENYKFCDSNVYGTNQPSSFPNATVFKNALFQLCFDFVMESKTKNASLCNRNFFSMTQPSLRDISKLAKSSLFDKRADILKSITLMLKNRLNDADNDFVIALLDAGSDQQNGKFSDGKLVRKWLIAAMMTYNAKIITNLLERLPHKVSKFLEFVVDSNCTQFLPEVFKLGFKIEKSEIEMSLIKSAQKGNLKDVEYFIKTQAADVNSVELEGKTSLMLACAAGHAPVIDYLLKKGADVNLKSKAGHTALHYAVRSENLNIVKILIAHKADKNAQDTQGATPLMLAAENNLFEIVEYLLQQKANSNSRINNVIGDTALSLAIAAKHTKTQQTIISHASDLDVGLNFNGKTYLTLAVVDGDEELLTYLIALKVNVNFLPGPNDKFKLTALMIAAYLGDIEKVKVLVETGGADLNLKNALGLTAKDCARKAGHREIVDYLESQAKGCFNQKLV